MGDTKLRLPSSSSSGIMLRVCHLVKGVALYPKIRQGDTSISNILQMTSRSVTCGRGANKILTCDIDFSLNLICDVENNKSQGHATFAFKKIDILHGNHQGPQEGSGWGCYFGGLWLNSNGVTVSYVT